MRTGPAWLVLRVHLHPKWAEVVKNPAVGYIARALLGENHGSTPPVATRTCLYISRGRPNIERDRGSELVLGVQMKCPFRQDFHVVGARTRLQATARRVAKCVSEKYAGVVGDLFLKGKAVRGLSPARDRHPHPSDKVRSLEGSVPSVTRAE